MLILKILALQPLNGWAISQRLKQISSDVLGVSDGSLYPALHKLEHRGWIRAQWKSSEKKPSSQVLFADAAGAEAARKGDGQLEPRLSRNLRHSKAQRGLKMDIEQWKTLREACRRRRRAPPPCVLWAASRCAAARAFLPWQFCA